MNIIFLDIDGVLNDLKINEKSGVNGIKKECVDQLNRIIDETDAYLVISSSWRYMVHGEAMKIWGFEYLLQTHGVNAYERIKDVTIMDEFCLKCNRQHKCQGKPCPVCGERTSRGQQIRKMLDTFSNVVENYVVIDDVDDGISENHLDYVKTNGLIGLTEKDADKAIAFLLGK